jgi:ABC-type multidrug transport system fused ATPase/permease subunit
MIDFVKTFICVVVAVVLFLIQKGLSSRKAAWLGGIMPVLTIISGVGLIWYMKWEISIRTVFPFVLLFALFTITWLSERAALKKSRSKEDIHGISN